MPRNYSGDLKRESQYLDLIRQRKFKDVHAMRLHSTKDAKFYNHMPISAVEDCLPLAAEDCQLVYCIRDPYEKIIPYANLVLSFANYSGKEMLNSFADIQKSICKIMQSGEYKKVYNLPSYETQLPYKSVVKLRHESIQEDFHDFIGQLGLSNKDIILPHAKKGVIDKHFEPLKLFTRAQLDEVNEVFAAEFDSYGYDRL